MTEQPTQVNGPTLVDEREAGETDRFYSIASTPIGDIFLESDGHAIVGLRLPNAAPFDQFSTDCVRSDALLKSVVEELASYFNGDLSTFTVPLLLRGTPFQQQVWRALLAIPYGTTTSYGQIAASIGRPTASRAVGMANNKNPIALFVPCHRVIGANGSLVGYAGGLELKRALLAHEADTLAGRKSNWATSSTSRG